MRLQKIGDHPVVTVITLLASVVAIVGFFRSCGPEPADPVTLEPCVEVIGRWDWLATGGTVSIAKGGGLSWYQTANVVTPTVRGTWTCDEQTGRLVLSWDTGFVDTLALSDDGERLSGTNNAGDPISATRAR